MVVATFAVLLGIERLIPDGAGALMGLIVWALFLATAFGGAVWLLRSGAARRL
jgi:Flp pilus assembly protein TadB